MAQISEVILSEREVALFTENSGETPLGVPAWAREAFRLIRSSSWQLISDQIFECLFCTYGHLRIHPT
jgi:hypothetical protein